MSYKKVVTIPFLELITKKNYHDEMCWLPENPVPSMSLISEPMLTIEFGKNANKAVVSEHSTNLLKEIMRASKNHKIIITSTLRTAEDQARAMYDNIISKGFDYNYNLYGSTGDKVIKAAEKARSKGYSKEKILEAMTAEINRIGPGKVSRHAGDPKRINVIDIAPSSVTHKEAFVKEIKKRRIFLLQPPADPAYHLEIKQP
jgi:hypothetical protein